jgi:hypothetical protein
VTAAPRPPGGPGGEPASAPTLQPGAVQALEHHGDQHGFACVFASGPGVFWHSARLGGRLSGYAGKEAVLIPARARSAPAARLAELRHAGEVQGLALRQLEDGERSGGRGGGGGGGGPGPAGRGGGGGGGGGGP